MTTLNLRAIAQYLKDPSYLPKLIDWYRPSSSSVQDHIFIFGAPRSGTTLMKLILGTHPNLASPGYETGFFTRKKILNNLINYDSNPQNNSVNQLRKESQDIIQFFDAYAQQVCEENQRKRFVEKTPSHVLRINFLIKHFTNSQFINMFRDGRDCYCSARHHPNVKQGSDLVRYAKYWKKCVTARLEMRNHPRVIDIKYEELVNNPEEVVKEMMEFLNEQYNAKQLSPFRHSKNSIMSSKREEFSKLSKPINSSSVSRFQKELSQKEIAQFHKIAGQELELLGYLS